jgi:hypothetical protein
MRTIFLLALSACVNGHHIYTYDSGSGSAAACTGMQTVTQDLTLTDNEILDAPTSCWVLNGKLTIRGTAVSSIAKLGPLTAVSELEIANSGLAKFDSPHAVEVRGPISIHDNAQLADIANISVTTGVVPSLHVDYNAQLADLGELVSAIQAVSGDASFVSNAKLAKLDLHQVARFDAGVVIDGNTALASIDLSGLKVAPTLAIRNNPALTTIADLRSLTLLGALTISNNATLTALPMATFSGEIAGDVTISDNGALTDLGRLAYAMRIDGALTITNNAALDYCVAKEVDCCVPTGPVNIQGNLPDNNCHSYCFTNSCPY